MVRKKFLNISKFLFIILCLLLTFITGLLFYRAIKQNKIFINTNLNCESCVDSLIKFKVNNGEITGLIRSKNINDKTILLFVHGGPGIPDIPFSRKFDELLVDNFICIHYDQRGIGKSISNFSIDQISIKDNVSDLLEISNQLRQKFKDKRIFLVGHSWGTLISFLALNENPNAFDYYIGISQIVNLKESDKISFDFTELKSNELNDTEAINFHKKFNRNNYTLDHKNLIEQRGYLNKFGGRFFDNSIKSKLTDLAISSPEYSLHELIFTKITASFLDQKLYQKMTEINLNLIAKNITTPTIFIFGKQDFNTPSILANELLINLKSKEKKLIIFDKSGHLPQYEENEQFSKILLGLIKK